MHEDKLNTVHTKKPEALEALRDFRKMKLDDKDPDKFYFPEVFDSSTNPTKESSDLRHSYLHSSLSTNAPHSTRNSQP